MKRRQAGYSWISAARSQERAPLAQRRAALLVFLGGALVGGAACGGATPDTGGKTPCETDPSGPTCSAGAGGASSASASTSGASGSSGSGAGGAAPLPTGKIEIGFWCGPPAAELSKARFDQMAAAGFTLASNACDGSTYTPTYNNQMLALAHESGLQAVVTDARTLAAADGTSVPANLDAVVADYGKAPGLFGYHLRDEPSTPSFGALAAAVSGLKQRDPSHPGIINLLPDYASTGQLGVATYDDYVGQFLMTVKPLVFSYDHYNFLTGGADGASFFANLAVARAQSVATKTPFWQYIQSISYNGHRDTTGPEKRWAALHTLAYGGTGVMYFTYWTPPQTAENFGNGIIAAGGAPSSQYADVTSINQTLAAMGRYLAVATSTGVFHNGPLGQSTTPRAPGAPVYIPSPAAITVGLFSVKDDAYALLVNRDYQAETKSDVYLASAGGAPELLDVSTGKFVPAKGATTDALGTKIAVTLAPGDGVLIHLVGPVPSGPPGAEAFFGSVRADAGSLDVVDASFGAQRLRGAGWGECPAGYMEVGRDFQSNGFWLCARADLAKRSFYVGNVVKDAGTTYHVQADNASNLGGGGWDTCAAGKLLGHRFDSNGFWVCME